MRTERQVQEIRDQYEKRLEERTLAAIEAKRLLHDQIGLLREQNSMLRDELRRAQMAGQEIANSAFAAMKVPPPHAGARPDRGGMKPVQTTRTWEQARIEAEEKERRKTPTEEKADTA